MYMLIHLVFTAFGRFYHFFEKLKCERSKPVWTYTVSQNRKRLYNF